MVDWVQLSGTRSTSRLLGRLTGKPYRKGPETVSGLWLMILILMLLWVCYCILTLLNWRNSVPWANMRTSTKPEFDVSVNKGKRIQWQGVVWRCLKGTVRYVASLQTVREKLYPYFAVSDAVLGLAVKASLLFIQLCTVGLVELEWGSFKLYKHYKSIKFNKCYINPDGNVVKGLKGSEAPSHS